jgi:hypothetical protein
MQATLLRPLSKYKNSTPIEKYRHLFRNIIAKNIILYFAIVLRIYIAKLD